jgi:hypothetical protein
VSKENVDHQEVARGPVSLDLQEPKEKRERRALLVSKEKRVVLESQVQLDVMEIPGKEVSLDQTERKGQRVKW